MLTQRIHNALMQQQQQQTKLVILEGLAMTDDATDFISHTHSDYLWAMAERDDLSLSLADRQRLRDVSILLKYRPDIDMAGNFQFEVGKTYPTRAGQLVTIISKKNNKGYECVQGDDGRSPDTGYRYSRSTGTGDHGRCTGSSGDCERNLLPIEIKDPRITKALNERDLFAQRAAMVGEWLDKQHNESGEEPVCLNIEWMDRSGFRSSEIRVAKIAIGYLVNGDTCDLREQGKSE